MDRPKAAGWRIYATRKFLARMIVLIQGGMLLCDLSWQPMLRLVQSAPGPTAVKMIPHYLRALGGSARYTSPILLTAASLDFFLPAEPELALCRTLWGWAAAGLILFVGLQLVGWCTFVALVVLLSWH